MLLTPAGSILLLPAATEVSVTASVEAPLVMFCAAVNSTFLQLSEAVADLQPQLAAVQ